MRVWLRNAYNLFSNYVIYRRSNVQSLDKEYGSSVPSDVRKPMGMVSESSERIYSRNWFEWVGLKSAEILGTALTLENGGVSSGNDYGIRRPIEAGSNLKNEQKSPNRLSPGNPQSAKILDERLTELASLQNDSVASFTVSLVAADDPNAAAERSWSSKSATIKDLSDWILLIASLWSGDNGLVNLTISALSGGKSSKISLPNKTPAEMAKAATRYIEATFQS